jgi:two-component system response regulator QseB
MRLLLVEDDAMIGESLCHALRADGLAVDWVQDGISAELALRNQEHHLLLLDLGLPGKTGLELLQWLRSQKNSLPVLILTARDGIEDRVTGLDAGADDYLVKPFALVELKARIRALLRRHEGRAEPLLAAADTTLDPATRTLTHQGKHAVLSAREYALMHALMERPGAVLSNAQLEERIYGWNEEITSNAIETNIYQLRKKFGSSVIRNLRGVGYMVGPKTS